VGNFVIQNRISSSRALASLKKDGIYNRAGLIFQEVEVSLAVCIVDVELALRLRMTLDRSALKHFCSTTRLLVEQQGHRTKKSFQCPPEVVGAQVLTLNTNNGCVACCGASMIFRSLWGAGKGKYRVVAAVSGTTAFCWIELPWLASRNHQALKRWFLVFKRDHRTLGRSMLDSPGPWGAPADMSMQPRFGNSFPVTLTGDRDTSIMVFGLLCETNRCSRRGLQNVSQVGELRESLRKRSFGLDEAVRTSPDGHRDLAHTGVTTACQIERKITKRQIEYALRTCSIRWSLRWLLEPDDCKQAFCSEDYVRDSFDGDK